MESDFSGFLCLGSLCLAPLVTFALGLALGKNKLPFRVRIERNTQLARYEVDDGETERK